MKALFIGGTGVISSACTQLAVKREIELYLLNRGESLSREIPSGAKIIKGDIRDKESAKKAIGDMKFDVVVDWIAFDVPHIETDIELFANRTKQFIFISSASVYHTPPLSLPVTESTPAYNPFWDYSQKKIAIEDRLMKEYREKGFPVTIVRPSHTYDKTSIPLVGRYTVIDRMRKGKKVIVHGDGTSIWVLTHHTDFAVGFVGLMGNNHAIGETFHITSDELLTWNQIYDIAAKALGVEANIVHVPSDILAKYDAEWGYNMHGDKAHSMIFDNTKIKRFVPDFNPSIPFSRGFEEIIAWYDGDPSRQKIDDEFNILTDKIITAIEAVKP